MNKSTLILCSLLLSFFLNTINAQEKMWVYFNDKGPEAADYLNNPEQHFSDKLIDFKTRKGLKFNNSDIPVSETYLQQLKDAGYIVVGSSQWLNAAIIEMPAMPESIKQTSLAIKKVIPVAQFTERPESTINGKPYVWKAKTQTKSKGSIDYGASTLQNDMLGINYLHDLGYTGDGVKIAVLDAGFPWLDTIPAFNSINIVAKYNVLDSSDNLVTGGNHGTMVLSTLAANLPGTMVGMAPDAEYYLAIAEPLTMPWDETDWVRAAEWAYNQGVDIIHSSLGYFYLVGQVGMEHFTYDKLNGDSLAITIAADLAAKNGVLVINSAGNTGQLQAPIFQPPHNPYICAPADGDSVLAVGGVDSNKVHHISSSYGPTSDGRIKPNIVAMGRDVSVYGYNSLDPLEISQVNGTSFSAPIMSGFAACLMQKHPLETNMDIFSAIITSADRSLTPDTIYGHGVPNAELASIACGIGIGENKRTKNNYTIYPNITSNHINIEATSSSNNEASSIRIFNQIGQEVINIDCKNLNWFTKTINVSKLTNGLYIVHIEDGEQVLYNGKFVKQ